MQSNGDVTPRPEPPAAVGLPTVEPPSGRLLFRMFVTPALIVAGVVLVVYAWLQGWNWLFGVAYSPEAFLKRLDDPNAEVRWRAAADLAQVLPRDDRLAADPNFALELARRLDRARDASRTAEDDYRKLAEGPDKEEAERARSKLQPERNYVNYLASGLGGFVVPAGAPLLGELAGEEAGLAPGPRAARRRVAVWALANLGENLKRFDALPAPRQDAALAALAKAADGDDARSAEWARAARRCLEARRDGRADAMGVDAALAKCAGADDDPYLRELAAFAMNFWRGDASAERRMEDALARLQSDDGRGEDRMDELSEDAPADSRAVTRTPGLRVRFNAAVALARRGSPKVNLFLLKDMLDPVFLREELLVLPKSGPDKPDPASVSQTLVTALKAVAELHRQRPETDLSELRPAIDALASDPNPVLREEAEKTRSALGKE
jgi:hypothetical protein